MNKRKEQLLQQLNQLPTERNFTDSELLTFLASWFKEMDKLVEFKEGRPLIDWLEELAEKLEEKD